MRGICLGTGRLRYLKRDFHYRRALERSSSIHFAHTSISHNRNQTSFRKALDICSSYSFDCSECRGPNVPDGLLRTLVALFADLRLALEEGSRSLR